MQNVSREKKLQKDRFGFKVQSLNFEPETLSLPLCLRHLPSRGENLENNLSIKLEFFNLEL